MAVNRIMIFLASLHPTAPGKCKKTLHSDPDSDFLSAAKRRKNLSPLTRLKCCPTSPRRGARTLARGKPRQRRNPWLCGPESWHPDWGAGTDEAKSPVVTLACSLTTG